MNTQRTLLIIGVAILLVILSSCGGYVACVIESHPPVVEVRDNVRMVHTEIGWRPWSAGDYTTDNSGALSAEYGWSVKTVMAALPITAGDCGVEQGCIEGR